MGQARGHRVFKDQKSDFDDDWDVLPKDQARPRGRNMLPNNEQHWRFKTTKAFVHYLASFTNRVEETLQVRTRWLCDEFPSFLISQFSNAVTSGHQKTGKNTQGVTVLQLSLYALVPSLFVFPGERGQSTSRLPTNLASHYQRSCCCDLSCKRSLCKDEDRGREAEEG